MPAITGLLNVRISSLVSARGLGSNLENSRKAQHVLTLCTLVTLGKKRRKTYIQRDIPHICGYSALQMAIKALVSTLREISKQKKNWQRILAINSE